MNPIPVSGAPTRRIAFVIAAAFFMQMLDGVIIATALPQMALSFGVLPVEMSVGITVYMLTSAIFIPVAGWLADRFGEKPIFLAAIAIFTLASLACGLAQNLPEFIAARAVQGVGGAFMVPVGRMIVLRNAPKSEVVNAIGMITWPALFAPVIGPALGGFITDTFGWRWTFFINLPIGLLGVVLVALMVPRNDERRKRPMDWLGFVLASTGLGALLTALELFVHGVEQPALPIGLLVLGVVTGALAIRHMRRAPTPLLDLGAFRHRTFAISGLFSGTYFRVAINATPFLLPLLFQVGFGLDPFASGSLIIAYFLGNLAMKTVTTPLLRWYGFRSLLFVNGVLSAISIALFAVFTPTTPTVLLIAVLVFAGATRSMQFTALTTLAFADIEPEERGAASTLSAMLQQLSMLLGVAVAAGCLNLITTLRGGGVQDLMDFQLTFLVFGAIPLAASLMILRLPHNAGAEVTGHVPKVRS